MSLPRFSHELVYGAVWKLPRRQVAMDRVPCWAPDLLGRPTRELRAGECYVRGMQQCCPVA